jgi:hypothetical protein
MAPKKPRPTSGPKPKGTTLTLPPTKPRNPVAKVVTTLKPAVMPNKKRAAKTTPPRVDDEG